MANCGALSKRQASSKENNNSSTLAANLHSGFVEHMKFNNKLANSNSTGPTLKSSSQSKGHGQPMSNRNPNFQTTNPTARIVNHPALISNQS